MMHAKPDGAPVSGPRSGDACPRHVGTGRLRWASPPRAWTPSNEQGPSTSPSGAGQPVQPALVGPWRPPLRGSSPSWLGGLKNTGAFSGPARLRANLLLWTVRLHRNTGAQERPRVWAHHGTSVHHPVETACLERGPAGPRRALQNIELSCPEGPHGALGLVPLPARRAQPVDKWTRAATSASPFTPHPLDHRPPQARAIIDTIRRMEAACGIQGLRSGALPPNAVGALFP